MLPGVAAAVDPSGTLHVLWQTGGANGNTIHYQVRNRSVRPDTALVHRGDSIQDFGIAAAADGGLHVIAEAAINGSSQILYQEMRPDGAWDVGATEVTRGTEPATRPMVLPSSPGHTTVLYLSYDGTGGALIERERGDWTPQLTAVPPDLLAPSALDLRVGPNPLRAGSPFHLTWAGAPAVANRLEIFDITGRRVASAGAPPSTGAAIIPASVTRGWHDGVYFVRAAGRERATFVVIR